MRKTLKNDNISISNVENREIFNIQHGTGNQKLTEDAGIQLNGNVYIAGKLSIAAIKTCLVAAQSCLMPTISAAAKEETPQRPPPMEYKNLSMYDCPHYKYKEYENDKVSCPDRKLMQEYLQPTVSDCRKQVSETFTFLKDEITSTCSEVRADLKESGNNLLVKARHPDNYNYRAALVAASGLAGLKFGKTIPRKIFWSGIGMFTTGSLCFPEETDECTRSFFHMLAKTFLCGYNFYFGTEHSLRERGPCFVPTIPTPPVKPSPKCNPPPKKK